MVTQTCHSDAYWLRLYCVPWRILSVLVLHCTVLTEKEYVSFVGSAVYVENGKDNPTSLQTMIEFCYSIILLTLKTEKFWKLSISFCPLVIVDISGKRTMRGCTCNPLAAWSMGSNRSCCPSHTRGQGWGWHNCISNILMLKLYPNASAIIKTLEDKLDHSRSIGRRRGSGTSEPENFLCTLFRFFWCLQNKFEISCLAWQMGWS